MWIDILFELVLCVVYLWVHKCIPFVVIVIVVVAGILVGILYAVLVFVIMPAMIVSAIILDYTII